MLLQGSLLIVVISMTTIGGSIGPVARKLRVIEGQRRDEDGRGGNAAWEDDPNGLEHTRHRRLSTVSVDDNPLGSNLGGEDGRRGRSASWSALPDRLVTELQPESVVQGTERRRDTEAGASSQGAHGDMHGGAGGMVDALGGLARRVFQTAGLGSSTAYSRIEGDEDDSGAGASSVLEYESDSAPAARFDLESGEHRHSSSNDSGGPQVVLLGRQASPLAGRRAATPNSADDAVVRGGSRLSGRANSWKQAIRADLEGMTDPPALRQLATASERTTHFSGSTAHQKSRRAVSRGSIRTTVSGIPTVGGMRQGSTQGEGGEAAHLATGSDMSTWHDLDARILRPLFVVDPQDEQPDSE